MVIELSKYMLIRFNIAELVQAPFSCRDSCHNLIMATMPAGKWSLEFLEISSFCELEYS